MQTREIPNEDWESFLNSFSQDHQGERISIEIESEDMGAQVSDENVILVGIADDRKASEGARIEVIASEAPETHATRVVQKPAHLRLAENEEGAPVALQIESRDGSVTLVRFVA